MLKDDRLDKLAVTHNVAQFISTDPAGKIRYQHVAGQDGTFTDVRQAIGALLASVCSVNVRAFRPGESKGAPFIYGLTRTDDALAAVRRLEDSGFHTIVNETVDVHDGGVSGVSLGGLVEFAPDNTPRAVEKDDTLAATREMAFDLLRTVYGLTPEIPTDPGLRVEFSIHPQRVGLRNRHTIVWEIESVDPVELVPRLVWPNHFSRLVGDKAFGLVIAHLLGLSVPLSTVVGRRLAPFSFGSDTGLAERWMRTCPVEQVPGRFTTTFGWSDPFATLTREDPTGKEIASVIAQQAVDVVYSGATRPTVGRDEDLVEGVAGRGDRFMLGEQDPVELPSEVRNSVLDTVAALTKSLGPVRIEWAYDGSRVWILQLHIARKDTPAGVISPGNAEEWLDFEPAEGLPRLRELVRAAVTRGVGIRVSGAIGVTSHVGDILRKAGVPARLVGPE